MTSRTTDNFHWWIDWDHTTPRLCTSKDHTLAVYYSINFESISSAALVYYIVITDGHANEKLGNAEVLEWSHTDGDFYTCGSGWQKEIYETVQVFWKLIAEKPLTSDVRH